MYFYVSGYIISLDTAHAVFWAVLSFLHVFV